MIPGSGLKAQVDHCSAVPFCLSAARLVASHDGISRHEDCFLIGLAGV